MSALSPGRVLLRATGLGAATGAILGACVGTCLVPLIGTICGFGIGSFLGLFFGIVNGIALAAVSVRNPGSKAATLTGALVSGTLGALVWWHVWPGTVSTAPAALFFLVLGAMLAPRAVTEAEDGAG